MTDDLRDTIRGHIETCVTNIIQLIITQVTAAVTPQPREQPGEPHDNQGNRTDAPDGMLIATTPAAGRTRT